MMHFDSQAVKDLEFDLIRLMLHDFCLQPTARLRMIDLEPLRDHRRLKTELIRTHEFLQIRANGIAFPALDFEELEQEIRLLQLRDSVLNEESFFRIYKANILVNEILQAFEGIEEACKELHVLVSDIEKSTYIPERVLQVFDNKWKVRDDASPELKSIRDGIVVVRRNISKNFAKVMRELSGKGFLGDTGEAYLNERKVLAVYSTHKRKVPGLVISSSKTGSLTYIEPEVNIQLNFELESLMDDERNEIRRILKELTQSIRHELPAIRNYQRCLTAFDFIQAKARMAADIDAILPEIEDEPVIDLRKAFHPLLMLQNRRAGRATFPQSLRMDRDSRMLVISGPNAGGKSITLKTVGLLQVMLQSGLLVPVAPGSKISFFHAVLTDIGDNQSIENQLSTYSYRLKRMKHFLDVANRRSLVLLDEFGTGSDPDLGGALAEVFFEELYNRKSFGVITTHYGNIKLKAAQLRNARNGCMLFNTQTLEPTYQLSIGQPGSSFTFEVAEINGIPKELIEAAKKKMSKQKVQMDEMLASLQDEKSKYQLLTQSAQSAGELASNAITEYEKKRERMEEKLQKQQDTMERNNKYLNHGRKLVQYIESYNLRTKNKELLDEVKKYLAMEKTKIEDARKQKSIQKSIVKQREEKKAKDRRTEAIKVGSTVRLENTKQTGKVIEMDKGQAVVAIGVFKTKVDLGKLEFIQ
ncbi:MAG: endonuclease MutS2 [Flavobacteriales bacterium]